jgi:uncharacterized protein YggE
MKTLLLKTLFICILAVFAPNISSAQENLPLVTVTGKGEVKVTPDEVAIRFGIVSIEKNTVDARRNVEAVIKQVNALLGKYKIPASQLTMDYLQLEQWPPDYAPNLTERQFRASQGITVVIKDISKFNEFLTELYNTGINRIDLVEYRTSELRKHQDAARDMAVRAAREKAEALAKSLGQSIGAAYSIEEFPENNYPMMRMANQSMDGGAAAETLGQISVTANVTVRFYLK